VTYRLYQGDCLDVLPTLTGVDAVITDPPYLTSDSGVTIGGNGGVAKTYVDSAAFGMPWGYSLDWVTQVARLKPQHWIVYCNQWMLGGLIAEIEKHAKLGAVFTWRKSNAPNMIRNSPRLDCEFIVWAKRHDAKNIRVREFTSQVLDIPFPQAGCFATERITINGGQAAHPTQKPLAVVRPFVQRLTEWGWTILDPFMGTGTTGEAALMDERNFIGVEKDARFFRMAERRIANAQPPLFVADAPVALPVEQATMFAGVTV
jgi:DNA modification methylase